MALKASVVSKQRTPRAEDDEAARFEAWLSDFDARQAGLTAKLDALLYSLGVDPARLPERKTA
jgi:hypothetical protein